MPSYTEDSMADAYLNVADNGMSVRKAAEKHGIPHTSLSARLRGRTAKAEAIQPAQLLSVAQEQRLVTWMLRQESLGLAPSISNVKEAVNALLDKAGDARLVGRNWIDGFKRRNPAIHTKIGRRQEASRFNGFTPKAVN